MKHPRVLTGLDSIGVCRRQPLGLNLIVLLVLVIAKFPSMHKVRIFGINKY